MSEITVLLFGPEARRVGADRVCVPADGSPLTCSALRDRLVREAPRLAGSLAGCRFAVNHRFADEQTELTPADEVALIGPVSGG